MMNPAILALVLWTAGVPKLSPNAYEGPTGWHDTVAYKDRKVHIEHSDVNKAIAVCREHAWHGYVQWNSSIGRETDTCRFIRKVAS